MSSATRSRLCFTVGAALTALVTALSFSPSHHLPLVPPVAVSSCTPLPDTTIGETPRWHQFTPAAPAPVDLYGNPVNDGVARYRLDATGSLYEVHSPRIELRQLAAPTS